jgi:predicted transposase/invertase (TIGR01784 family)
MKEKYINPFTDFGFKKLFGEEPNKDLLIDFLNQILPQHHQIKDLTYLNAEHLGIAELDRKAMFDLYCESQSGEKFIVEMQKAKQNFFKDRSVYYTTFPVQQQAKRGEIWNYELKAVYFVGILDFVFAENINNDEVLHEVKLKNKFGNVFYDKLTFIYLEMPKFTKTLDELKTSFDKWLYILKHLPRLQERPAKLQEKVFNKLFESAQIAKFNQEEMKKYDESLKVYWDMNAVIETARDDAFDEGKFEGKIEGKLEGVLQEKSDRIAKALLRGKLSVEEIVEDFEVEKDFVLKIKQHLNQLKDKETR